MELYKVGGGKEGMLDEMNKGLGWKRVGKWLMGEKRVFVVVRGVIGKLYKLMMGRVEVKRLGVKGRRGMKGFVLKLMCVGGKWVRR